MLVSVIHNHQGVVLTSVANNTKAQGLRKISKCRRQVSGGGPNIRRKIIDRMSATFLDIIHNHQGGSHIYRKIHVGIPAILFKRRPQSPDNGSDTHRKIYGGIFATFFSIVEENEFGESQRLPILTEAYRSHFESAWELQKIMVDHRFRCFTSFLSHL